MAKEPTPAQLEARRKFAEAAKARAAARKAEKEGKAPELQAGEQPQETISQQELNDLQRQILELKQALMSQQAPQGNNLSFKGGQLTGTFEKYKIGSQNYPDPRKRLSSEPRLARFAFDINYELNWHVGVSEYTTIDGIRTKEPKFTLELVRVIVDEDTGEPTNGRYVVCRLIMHEDPEAALIIARNEGIDVDEMDEKSFLDEMRYLRMREWLLECFYPSPVVKPNEKKDMVIGGTIVEYFEVTSEDKPKVDFSELKRF